MLSYRLMRIKMSLLSCVCEKERSRPRDTSHPGLLALCSKVAVALAFSAPRSQEWCS